MVAPVAVKLAVVPEQIEPVDAATVTVGTGLTVKVNTFEEVHDPLSAVTV